MLRDFIFISLSLLPHLLLILGGSTGASDLNRAARVTRQARTSVLTVGAIIESDDEVRQIAVARAVDQANAFFASRMDRVSLTHDIRQISPGDSFQANREACSLLEKGVVAIVGPTSPAAAEQVRSVCEHHTMPHIAANWNYRATERRLHYSVNLNPHHGTLGSALMDFIRSQETWGHFAIIYRDPDTLLKYELMLNKLETPVITRQWVKKSGSYKHILTDLKNAGVFGYFVDIPVEDVLKFMILAKAMNMTSANHSYIFTSWDVQRLDLSDFQVVRTANFTAISMLPLVPPAGQYGRGSAVERMRAEIFNIETQRAQYRGLLENMIPMAAAIVFDSIQLLANGIHFTSRAQPVEPQPMTCGTGQRFWQNGASLLNFMRSIPEDISPQTLTGPVKFDSDWRRVNFSLRAYELTSVGFRMIGSWDRLHGFNISRTFQEPLEEVQKKLQNKTLRVTTVEDAPFIKVKNKNDSNSPPQFDGFCIQMLNLIAQEAGFNFTVRLVEDGNYGTKTGNDSEGNEVWNGMIGELIDKKADLAVAPLTITYERERVIDFTTPYMSLGLSILFKKPVKTKPHLFSFLSPLSPTVWSSVLAAYVFVSFVLFVVAQLSPYEWYNPNPCSTDTEQVENQFSMLNSLWFTVGSLMQQGSEIWPRALSTRLISGIWWFFTLIMISSYTANLAAFLTVERMHSPIESVEDLARQTKIKYGTLASGSTYQFFKMAKSIQVFKTMWDFMSKRPEVFVNKTEDGIRRVRQGGYAFILESTMNEYYTERNCDLMKVGGLLDSKGYGIGLTTGSPFRDIISEVILKLQKEQVLEKLRRRWWREEDIEKPCDEASSDGQEEPPGLGIDQVAGVYVVLLGGMLLGGITTLVEFCFRAKRRAVQERQSISTELCQELRFASRCFGSSTRPANHLAQRAHRATAAAIAATAAATASTSSSNGRRQAARLVPSAMGDADWAAAAALHRARSSEDGRWLAEPPPRLAAGRPREGFA
ncbi:hypothetical protein BOX15_Mlig000431g1 [Macrostomum lignano]|uniref:Glutamate receptor n=1 Tax=Macrostomum lignano TaxID=282301 RepID=A0A267GTS8_9PLAT|nr:hypothetical protein BOX15_Mlig000431g1 [Macrostomum lignano]